MAFCFEALEGAKISSDKPVSSQKYENGYRTKICDFTVVRILSKWSPVQVHSSPKSLFLHFFFLFQIEDLENHSSKSFRSNIMKKKLHTVKPHIFVRYLISYFLN